MRPQHPSWSRIGAPTSWCSTCRCLEPNHEATFPAFAKRLPTRQSSSSPCRTIRAAPATCSAQEPPATCSSRPPSVSWARRSAPPPAADSYIDPELGGALAKLEADPLEALERARAGAAAAGRARVHQPRDRRAALPQRPGDRGQSSQAVREAGGRVAPGAGPIRDRQRGDRAGRGCRRLRHQPPTGSVATTSVPLVGSERTSISPPSSATRSRIPISPRPSPAPPDSKPVPSSSTTISHRFGIELRAQARAGCRRSA